MNVFLKLLLLTIVFSVFTFAASFAGKVDSPIDADGRTWLAEPTPQKTPTRPSNSNAIKGTEFSRAMDAYKAKNFEAAVDGFRKAAKADPKNPAAHYFLGKSFVAQEKEDEAILAFKEAIQLKPDHAEANFSLGGVHYGREEYEKSLPYFERAVKTNNKSPEMLMALGDNQLVLRKYDVAIVQYGRVVGFEPDNANAYYSMGLIYISLNNKIAARQIVRKLESLDKGLAKKLADQIGR
jgi:tetratricopeptide (TPR) repeat protein